MIDFYSLRKVARQASAETQKAKALPRKAWKEVSAENLLEFFFERSGILIDSGVPLQKADDIAKREACERYRVAVLVDVG